VGNRWGQTPSVQYLNDGNLGSTVLYVKLKCSRNGDTDDNGLKSLKTRVPDLFGILLDLAAWRRVVGRHDCTVMQASKDRTNKKCLGPLEIFI
jgi:hypothetical protein